VIHAGLAGSLEAVAQVHQRARRPIEAIALFELLARFFELLFENELSSLFEQGFGGDGRAPIGVRQPRQGQRGDKKACRREHRAQTAERPTDHDRHGSVAAGAVR
jgi:hypothetical protein